ncbi:hypothetical protein [Helicobacter ganmani]|uniref:hypothetical protein n=1 Tax=Helicobacter ganmani TaxID=60246 RepID=UPI003A839660
MRFCKELKRKILSPNGAGGSTCEAYPLTPPPQPLARFCDGKFKVIQDYRLLHCVRNDAMES